MNLKERLNQINARLAQIDEQLRTASDVAAIDTLSGESTKLIEERGRITVQIAQEARSALNSAETLGTEVIDNDKADPVIKGYNARQKVAFVAGRLARGKGFSSIEKRALGVALTTTADAYVKASDSANGVNNGGVFITTKVLLDLLKDEGLVSPILTDVSFTYVKGLTRYPYRKSRTKAEVKTEGNGTGDGQNEYDYLDLKQGKLQSIVTVTDELLNLSDFALGEYLVNQLMQDLTDDWVSDIIYGTGTGGRISGVTLGATATTYAKGKEIDAIIDAIKACKKPYSRGAKLYVAEDLYKTITFARDSNGNFMYPVFNNKTGLSSVGTINMEIDEGLNAGEFVIGNVSRWYKANMLSPVGIEPERHSREGVTDYIATEFCAAAPFKGAFVYGKPTV